MLSIEQRIQQLLNPRTLPPELNITGGTGVAKFIQAINASGAIEKYQPAIRKVTKTQLTSELMKLQGDPTLQHIIHKVPCFVEYNENDFKLMNKEFGPLLMNDWDKLWNSYDYDSLESALDLFFGGPCDLKQMLNASIVDLLNKFSNEPIGYVTNDYTNRTRIGIYLQTSLEKTETYNRVIDELLRPYLSRKGYGLITVHSQALKEDGFPGGKAELNRYINSQVDMVLEQPNTENGFVIVSPGWAYSGRSMTEGRLDVGLKLRNGENSQDSDRPMSFCAKTIDDKKKLCALQVSASFTEQTQDWTKEIGDCVRDLYTEQKQQDPNSDPLGPWIRGANIFRRMAQTGAPLLINDKQIKNILTDSERAFRDCVESISHTDVKFWNSNILDILAKLNISKGKTKTKKLIETIKKRVTIGSKTSKAKPTAQTKTQQQEIRDLLIYIMEALVGIIGIMKGVAAEYKLFTVRELVEHVALDPTFSQAFEKNLGITPEEYLTILDTNAIPESSLNHLLQGYIEEIV